MIKIIFGYANAGLGHLRVTDALMDAIPGGYKPYVINPQDTQVKTIHRFTSTLPILRIISEWLQNGIPAEIFKKIYIKYVSRSSKNIKIAFKTLLKSWKIKPEKVLVICTHFGLAIQLGKIKKELETEENVKIFIVVQVTDDSPQSLWYVEGVDLTFVPSEKTKKELMEYGKRRNLEPINFAVNPYPLGDMISSELTEKEFEDKQKQVDINFNNKINFSIPISGAAVGMFFNKILIEKLTKFSPRFFFHVVTREAPYTMNFIESILNFKNVEIVWSDMDMAVVSNYENVFRKNVISMEVTKPSEQSFKAILSPKTRGGAIMLFTKPVGRQEYDNLDFLIRHELIPDENQQKKLYLMAEKNQTVDEALRKNLLKWRGLRLPENPWKAAEFIWWCEREMFTEMMKHKNIKTTEKDRGEIGNNGGKQFWEKTFKFLGL